MADYEKMLVELRREYDLLSQAILVLEHLVTSQRGKRRGRPPKWLADIKRRKENQTAVHPACVQ